MKASAVFALIPFLNLSAALPITEVVSETLNKTLQARYNYNWCDGIEYNDRTLFTMGLNGWGNNDASSRSGCGTGLLDNLRGQCGGGNAIEYWGCEEIHENPHDTKVTFTMHSFFRAPAPQCIYRAVELAAINGQTGMICHIRKA